VDDAGNYHWVYVDALGERKEFMFTPSSKIEPHIRTDVTSSGDRDFRYNYIISNGPSASQKLYRCLVDVELPTAVTATPAGWEPPSQPNDIVPRLLWYMRRVTPAERAGISAGSEVSGFQLQSSTLPGVVEFRCTGNVESPQYPSDLPQEINDQVGGLLGTDFVKVSALGPAIAGLDDPAPTLVRRIVRAYRQPLQASALSEKALLVKTLDEAIGPTVKDDYQLRRVLLRFLELVSLQKDSDPWARDLLKGLEIAVGYVAARLPEKPGV
jgi:hypothetical protein